MTSGDPWASWYARLLRARHVAPGPVASFFLCDCVVISAVMLAFADAISWWLVVASPLLVAGAVKAADAWVTTARRSALRLAAPARLPRPGAQLVSQTGGAYRLTVRDDPGCEPTVRSARAYGPPLVTLPVAKALTHSAPPGPRARTAPNDVLSVPERASDPFMD